MSLTFDNGKDSTQFATQYELVEHACKNKSPFLTGDENLVNLTKWYAVENKDKNLIQLLEDAGHDMVAYIKQHKAREEEYKTLLANL